MNRPVTHRNKTIDGISIVARPGEYRSREVLKPRVIKQRRELNRLQSIEPQVETAARVLPNPAPGNSRPKSRPKLFKRKNIITNVAILLLLSLAEITPYFLARPYMIAILYVFLALILRIESRKTFSLALLFLLMVPLLRLANQQPLAEIYATLSYFFLMIGVATAVLEMKLST